MTVQSILDGKAGGVVSVGPDELVSSLVSILCDARVGAALVLDDLGRLVGIVSERDIVRVLGRQGDSALSQPVSEVMTRKVQTCAPSDSIGSLMAAMTEGRFRHMPVMEGDEMIGLISIGDVVAARLADLHMEKEALTGMIMGN